MNNMTHLAPSAPMAANKAAANALLQQLRAIYVK